MAPDSLHDDTSRPSFSIQTVLRHLHHHDTTPPSSPYDENNMPMDRTYDDDSNYSSPSSDSTLDPTLDHIQESAGMSKTSLLETVDDFDSPSRLKVDNSLSDWGLSDSMMKDEISSLGGDLDIPTPPRLCKPIVSTTSQLSDPVENFAKMARLASSNTGLKPIRPKSASVAKKMTVADDPDRPDISYVGLIAEALLSVPDCRLILGDIYQYIQAQYPFYNRGNNHGWRNSVRHNLSLNPCFIKDGRSDHGKGNFWAINPEAMDDFRQGNYKFKISSSKRSRSRKRHDVYGESPNKRRRMDGPLKGIGNDSQISTTKVESSSFDSLCSDYKLPLPSPLPSLGLKVPTSAKFVAPFGNGANHKLPAYYDQPLPLAAAPLRPPSTLHHLAEMDHAYLKRGELNFLDMYDQSSLPAWSNYVQNQNMERYGQMFHFAAQTANYATDSVSDQSYSSSANSQFTNSAEQGSVEAKENRASSECSNSSSLYNDYSYLNPYLPGMYGNFPYQPPFYPSHM